MLLLFKFSNVSRQKSIGIWNFESYKTALICPFNQTCLQNRYCFIIQRKRCYPITCVRSQWPSLNPYWKSCGCDTMESKSFRKSHLICTYHHQRFPQHIVTKGRRLKNIPWKRWIQNFIDSILSVIYKRFRYKRFSCLAPRVSCCLLKIIT